ncbi:hypothetical protein H0H93_006645 [Arthromyces matolae]|nr:hypothetical protein H0H93_006645 [Arthromyces matolae]
MSSTIYVQKHVRDAWKALPFISRTPSHSRVQSANSNPATPSPLQSTPLQSPRTPPALSQALPTLLRHRSSRAHLGQPAPFVPKQLIPQDFILYLQKLAQNAYVSSQLSLYMSDLFSAIRHHPKLDGTFLTAKCMNDAQDLARAGRVIGTDPTGGELLRYYPPVEYDDKDNEEDGYLEKRRTSEEMHEYIGSGSESVTINIHREPTPSTSRAAKDYEVPSISVSGSEEDVIKSMFVSEAAIARVVPRAVTHRLRVRDPWDEVLAGAVFGATFEPQKKESDDGDEYHWDTKSTVKDILTKHYKVLIDELTTDICIYVVYFSGAIQPRIKWAQVSTSQETTNTRGMR